MNESRCVIAQFCDDIRQEVGNKYSLMGCYGDDIILEKLPSALPKLCAKVLVITPKDRPFEKLVIRAIMKSDTLAEMEMPSEQLLKSKSALPADRWSDALRLSVIAMLVFSPFVVSEPGILRIEVETEEGVIQGSKIWIRQRDTDPAQIAPPQPT